MNYLVIDCSIKYFLIWNICLTAFECAKLKVKRKTPRRKERTNESMKTKSDHWDVKYFKFEPCAIFILRQTSRRDGTNTMIWAIAKSPQNRIFIVQILFRLLISLECKMDWNAEKYAMWLVVPPVIVGTYNIEENIFHSMENTFCVMLSETIKREKRTIWTEQFYCIIVLVREVNCLNFFSIFPLLFAPCTFIHFAKR